MKQDHSSDTSERIYRVDKFVVPDHARKAVRRSSFPLDTRGAVKSSMETIR